ncbi:UNVERIFIED_CONTAM: hypothetical protein HDU68_010757 [Siphonaria sp. JEL0065]|nr:hypothetical protein HDU68_010757 [Siphonaria sp. JEL0065]
MYLSETPVHTKMLSAGHTLEPIPSDDEVLVLEMEAELKAARDRDTHQAEYDALITKVKAELAEEKQQAMVANQSNRNFNANGSSPQPVHVVVMPSTAKFGVAWIEPARTSLKQLPSLSSCPWIDIYADMMHEHTEAADTFFIRKAFMKMIQAKYNILDTCNTMDRYHALEIIEHVDCKNRQHLDYILDILKAQDRQNHVPAVLRNVADQPCIDYFTTAVSQISSLNTPEAHVVVQVLCDAFVTQSKSDDVKVREAMLFELILVRMQLRDMCETDEDRIQLMTIIEVAREKGANRRLTENMLEALQVSE